MFGYVIADLARLSEAQRARYHGFYCGVCRALYAQYGLFPALTLTYDMTFLALLLSALYEPEEYSGSGRCLRHPMQPHGWIQTEFTAYAAAMNCLLASENFLDDWQDDRKLSAAAAAGLLSAGAKKAAARYPDKTFAIRSALQTLARTEKDASAGVDTPAKAFAALMQALFTVKDDHWTQTLQRFGQNLGKLIYFMDAACDLDADRKAGRYNPLLPLGLTSGSEFHPELSLLAGDAAAEFERLPIVQDAALLQNILYSGIWTRFESAFRTQEAHT